MSALEDRITEVVAAHSQADEWGYPVEECRCGETFQGSYAAHVAERIAAALQLTEETERVQCLEPGCTWSYGCGHDSRRRRWVSEWTPVVEETP